MGSMRVFEVGLRDGLQNEARAVSLAQKIALTQGLLKAGIREIEAGAFVRKDKVPQMADSDALFEWIAEEKQEGRIPDQARWVALVPNPQGFERARKVGVENIAVFTAATETFNRKNIGMSIEQSLEKIQEVLLLARESAGMSWTRGYVSTAWGCPFEGRTSVPQAMKVIQALLRLGVNEISIGDTIGVADPRAVKALLKAAIPEVGVERLAVHFHDTRGTALANTLRALDLGITCVDSSVGGLGGCPFAPGATGNLATEDLIYMLNGMGLQTGVDLDILAAESLAFHQAIGRPLSSRYLQAYASECQRKS
jgi:hydroxymethylglutaryl-CoA lyase